MDVLLQATDPIYELLASCDVDPLWDGDINKPGIQVYTNYQIQHLYIAITDERLTGTKKHSMMSRFGRGIKKKFPLVHSDQFTVSGQKVTKFFGFIINKPNES